MPDTAYSPEELKRQLPADLYTAIAEYVDGVPASEEVEVEKEFVKSDLQPQSDPEVRSGVHTVNGDDPHEVLDKSDEVEVDGENSDLDEFYEEVDQ